MFWFEIHFFYLRTHFSDCPLLRGKFIKESETPSGCFVCSPKLLNAAHHESNFRKRVAFDKPT